MIEKKPKELKLKMMTLNKYILKAADVIKKPIWHQFSLGQRAYPRLASVDDIHGP